MESRGKHLLSILENKTFEYEGRVALGMRSKYGWRELTYKGLGLLSRKLARYLIEEVGVAKGDRLAILSESKPEYGACVFASVLAGTITVPLDHKLTIYELKSILSDSEPSVILVSRTYIDKAYQLRDEIPSLKTIIVMDEDFQADGIKNIYELPDIYDAKWRLRGGKSTALIIYTSGTTGAPKGVEITFGNITSQLIITKEAFDKILPDNRRVSILSILPMNHMFELTVGFSSFLSFGYSIYYTKGLKPKEILKMMRDKEIEFMIIVPAFLKLLKMTLETENINKYTKLGKWWFDIKYHYIAKFLGFGRIKKFLFRDLHRQFGGRFWGCLSGGAPMDVEVAKFFNRIGIKVCQGYGLTETSPVVALNTDKINDYASIGKPYKSWKYKTDSKTGELLLKGPSVMKGYYNKPELTASVLEPDGWFHTGDIAKIGPDGHIYITGRIKNMIVLSGGKKVFPEEVEAVLEKSEYIAEVCVFGATITSGSKKGTEEVVAVLVPKETLYEDKKEDEVENLVRADAKELLERLTPYKRPANIIIRKETLPRTTTNKVKRKEVKELILQK